jgi:hypothetical protein
MQSDEDKGHVPAVGDLVRFHHDVVERSVLARDHCGMLEISGISGWFAPHLFRLVRPRAQLDDAARAAVITTFIAQIEAAKEGARELDAIVAQAIGWKLWRSKHGYWNLDGPDGQRANTFNDAQEPRFDPDTGEKNPLYDVPPLERLAENADLPLWTSSLDAAVKLIPAGTDWLLARGRLTKDEKQYGAVIYASDSVDGGVPPEDREIGIGESESSLALAVCIAALRARLAR